MPVIKVISADYGIRYVERLNGFALPTLTYNIKKAKDYKKEDAGEYLEDVVKSISVKEKCGVDVELVPAPSANYREHWGEPRRLFLDANGNAVFRLYMSRRDDGTLIYAYDDTGEKLLAVSEDGKAIVKAFCVACCNYDCERIVAYERRKANV